MTWLNPESTRQRALWLMALIALALGLRWWGIGYGLPYTQLPDESADIATALQIVQGQTPLYTFHRVVWSTTLIPVYGLYYLYLEATQPAFDLSQFEALYYTQRATFILLARLALGIWSSLAVLVACAVGWRLTRAFWGGWLAGLFVAIHPAQSYLAHIAIPDAFATVWVALALLAALAIYTQGTRRAYALAGAAAALTILTRLQAAPILLPIAVAHLLRWWQHTPRHPRRLLRGIGWSIAAGIGASLLFNPFIVLQPTAVSADVQFVLSEHFTGAARWQPELRATNPLSNLVQNAALPWVFLRPYMWALGAVGLGVALRRRSVPALLVALAAVALTGLVLIATAPRMTYWLAAGIPLALLAAYGGWWLLTLAERRLRWVGRALVVIISLWGLGESAAISQLLTQPATQMRAYDYITTQFPAGTRIMQGDSFVYSVPLARTPASMTRLGNLRTLPPAYAFYRAYPALNRAPAYEVFGDEYRAAIQSDADMRAFLAANQIEIIIEVDFCQGAVPYELVSGLTFPILTSPLRAELERLYVASPFGSDTCPQPIDNRTPLQTMDLAAWQAVGPIVRVYRVLPIP